MLENYLKKKAIDIALSAASDFLSNDKSKLATSVDQVENSLNHHLRFVKSWASEISFEELKQAKMTEKVYLPLDFFQYPRKIRIEDQEKPNRVSFELLLKDPDVKHSIILGQPGAGKTTFMKYLCRELLINENFYPANLTFPIVIRFREINTTKLKNNRAFLRDILFNTLKNILGLQIIFPDFLSGKENIRERLKIQERILVDFLEELQPLIILDGFDELSYKPDSEIVLQELRTLTSCLEKSLIILTSRTGEFNYKIDNTSQFEISPLNKKQIKSFCYKWLNSKEKSNSLLRELKKSPYFDTTIRPLTLAHICAIFERVGKIPEKPKTIYKKVVNLLLEYWDQQRSVYRSSKYSEFEIDRKFEFLSNLAYKLTSSVGKSVFDKRDLKTAYTEIHQNYSLPLEEAEKVVEELETHTGLFVQAGFDLFEFSHKSIQEYLTAEYIVRLPSLPKNLINIPNEMAIAVAISSNPSLYFSSLIFDRLQTVSRIDRIQNISRTFSFIQSFVSRLLIEKPVFYKGSNIGVALICLYSMYIQVTIKNTKQNRLFVTDKLGPQFDNLGNIIKEKFPIKDLFNYYYVFKKKHDIATVPILHMKQKTNTNIPLPKTLARLPMELYVRQNIKDQSY